MEVVMRHKATLVAWFLLASLVLPGTATAEPKTWTFSALGGLAQYSNRFRYPADSLDDAAVFGIRVGRRFVGPVMLEAAASYGSTNDVNAAGTAGSDVTVLNVSGALLGQVSPDTKLGYLYLGVGGGYNQYDSDAAPEDAHFGTFEALAGWMVPFGDVVGLRLEARNILNLKYPREGSRMDDLMSSNKADQQYWAGLSFGFGGAPKDTDGDGVVDRRDKCPDTPRGATVNAEGCPTDSDGDGVWDGLDQCVGTPQGATVDAKGCPTDADADGVYDGVDQCGDTPRGATVDARGCPADSDGDGVMDGIDQCASTPKGATVDEKGCPKDSDNDGVPDGIDTCPDTPAGLRVDAAGCPIEVTERETELLDTGMIRLQNVNFETGKSTLLEESFTALDEVGVILTKWPQLQIEIGGHTDSRGSIALNQTLSEARAQAVKDYLVGKFTALAAAQLTVKGYGESRPIAKNTSALNMAKNRRVEFKVLNRDVLKKEIERRKMLQK
jgi:outer membrane protein OmpA-like peptidoglycan-associated protein